MNNWNKQGRNEDDKPIVAEQQDETESGPNGVQESS